METTIQAVMIIATFSLAHERFLEFVRWWIGKLPWPVVSNALDHATKGAWAWVPAIGLSIATNANLIDAFHVDSDHQPLFFTNYLGGLPADPRAIIGCCIMGLAVTLGSSFWHDFAKGLIEFRGKLLDASARPEQQLARAALRPVPPTPTEPGLVPA